MMQQQEQIKADAAFAIRNARAAGGGASVGGQIRGRPVDGAQAQDPNRKQNLLGAPAAPVPQAVQPVAEMDGWIPISLDNDFGGATMCRLNFAAHAANPAKVPMFKDLVRVSDCSGRNTKHVPWSVIERIAAATKEPNGFVFHESRVGSTLVADMLASDASNMVFSESKPPPLIASHCNGCSEEKKVALLRTTIRAMGNSARHKRLFFKFQSSNSPNIRLFLKAFPNTPWIYLYRDPVEVLASQFKQGGSPPCSRGNSPQAIKELFPGENLGRVSNIKYCAGRLGMFGDRALEALQMPSGGGVVVNYKLLPSFITDTIIVKHFHYGQFLPSVPMQMLEIAKVYSKSRNTAHPKGWVEDTEHKQNTATDEMKALAQQYMIKSYTRLEAKSAEQVALLANAPSSVLAVDGGGGGGGIRVVSNPGRPPVGGGGNRAPRSAQTQHIQGGAHRSLQDKYPVPSATGNRPEGGGYIPTGLEGTPVPQSEHEISEYLPFPVMQPLTELLEIWPPDQPDVPTDIPGIHAGSLARFDFRDLSQRQEAKRLQMHEVPFMLTNVDDVDRVTKLWSDDYLIREFGNRPQHVLKSNTNHFMYWSKQSARNQRESYTPPTKPQTMTFKEFLHNRDIAETQPVETDHIYLQINSDAEHRFIPRDLKMFEAKRSFWIVDPKKNRGINCRWGAKGIIAETHYDGGRNFVAMLRGSKRYVLSPPEDCPNLYLWPRGHPEGRHSKADWSKLDLDEYPLMKQAKATQVVVRAGEVLYIPSYWFHYIVSQGGSIQCNTRSGSSIRGRDEIKQCGFY